MLSLPDVNVLLPLIDPIHPHHAAAKRWFDGAVQKGWATCPFVENGVVRIVTLPSYANGKFMPYEVTALLGELKAKNADTHTFLADTVSLTDNTLFDTRKIMGSKQVTDLYLLGLCQRTNATFVTFDGGMLQTAQAIVGARADLVRVLTP